MATLRRGTEAGRYSLQQFANASGLSAFPGRRGRRPLHWSAPRRAGTTLTAGDSAAAVSAAASGLVAYSDRRCGGLVVMGMACVLVVGCRPLSGVTLGSGVAIV
jgi:hypothetical protein